MLVWLARPSHIKRKVWGHAYTAFVTLPKSGKGQSDRSVGFRVHSMTINLCDDIFTRYYFHKVRKRMSERFREAAKSLGYDRLKPEQESSV